MIEQDMKHSENTSTARLDGDTPNLRLFALLETVAQKSVPFTLQNLVDELGLPSPPCTACWRSWKAPESCKEMAMGGTTARASA